MSDPNSQVDNIYAAPETPTHSPLVAGGRLHVIGNRIAGTAPFIFPDRCIATNTSGENTKRVTKKLYRVHPACYLALLLNILLFLIVYLVARKRCDVEYTIDRSVARKKSALNLLAIIGLLLGAGLACVGFITAYEPSSSTAGGLTMGFVGVAMVIGALILNAKSTPLRVVAHNSGSFELKGFGQEFLDSVEAEHGSPSVNPPPIAADPTPKHYS